MRKIIVLSMITLDGIMQAPGGVKEDPSGGFKYGGWTASYGDEVFARILKQELEPADYLLGRKTFQIWDSYWPEHAEFWPGINAGTKYVLSKTRKNRIGATRSSSRAWPTSNLYPTGTVGIP